MGGQYAVILRSAGAGDAIGGQEGGQQVGGVGAVGVAQGQEQGHRFAGVNDAVDRSALRGQGHTRRNNQAAVGFRDGQRGCRLGLIRSHCPPHC